MGRLHLKMAIAVMSVLLLGVLLTPPLVAVAGSAQVWYLTDVPLSSGMAMDRWSTTRCTPGYTTIASHGHQYWLADETAVYDVIFGGDDVWMVELKTDFWNDLDDCFAEVGEWNTNTLTFTAFNTVLIGQNIDGPYTDDGGSTYYYFMAKYQLQQGDATVYQNNRLALKITNNDASASHNIYVDGKSDIKSPGTDTGYPVPNIIGLGTIGIVIMSGSLLVLIGYFTMKQGKKLNAGA